LIIALNVTRFAAWMAYRTSYLSSLLVLRQFAEALEWAIRIYWAPEDIIEGCRIDLSLVEKERCNPGPSASSIAELF